ncbi:MAG: methionyl-tRNA formyltransferase [Bacillota bacterium]
MKIIFMGTPEFAVHSLEALVNAGHEVMAVISQPDKKKGRGNKLQKTPVKVAAETHDLPVYQPEKARDPEFVAKLEAMQPDLIAVTAYGQILPESILNIPKFGCINVHGSLLPKYRGAAPMQWAIIDGEATTGITTMYMAKGMDTGDMLLTVEIPILDEDNFPKIHDKMAKAGADLLVETLAKLESGDCQRIPQNDSEATHARMIYKEDGCISWEKSGRDIKNLVRGLDPSPAAYTVLDGEMLKIFWGEAEAFSGTGALGEVLEADKNGILVKCGDGAFRILELQMKGKKRMAASAFLLGNAVAVGTVLG